jgi:multiple antibiotic resistance protein
MTLVEYALLAPVSLFAILSPISLIPIFLGMTPHDTPEQRIKAARTACLAAGVILLLFAITGQLAFSALGVSLTALQIAGGILLFAIAFDMLQARESEGKISREERAAGQEKKDIAITPLAVPLLAGPGAITTTIILQSQASTWMHLAILCLSLAGVLGATFLLMRVSASGAEWLNPIVIRLVRRLVGLLLAALAVQFVLNGLAGLGVIGSPGELP